MRLIIQRMTATAFTHSATDCFVQMLFHATSDYLNI